MATYLFPGIKTLAQDIVQMLTHPPYLLPNGLLSREVIDGQSSKEHLVYDLGDYLPFFYLFGGEKFCRDHLNICRDKLTSRPILEPRYKLHSFPAVYCYDYSDLLYGLLWFANLHRSETVSSMVNIVIQTLNKTFFNSQYPRSIYLPSLHLSVPIFDSRDGMYLELFSDNPGLVAGKKIDQIHAALTKSDLFQRFGLFPSMIPVFPIDIINTMPVLSVPYHLTYIKHTANSIRGLLSYFRLTNNETVHRELLRAVNASINYFLLPNGFFIHECYFKNGRVISPQIHSASNHTAIDLFCDLAYYLDNNYYLTVAAKIADAWLCIQGKTGLFPVSPNAHTDDLDSQTDMIIALKKLSELTGDKSYNRSAAKAMEGVLKYHRQPAGFAFSADVHTGKIDCRIYKTKFIALFLKAIYSYLDNRSIYGHPDLFDILKDR